MKNTPDGPPTFEVVRFIVAFVMIMVVINILLDAC